MKKIGTVCLMAMFFLAMCVVQAQSEQLFLIYRNTDDVLVLTFSGVSLAIQETNGASAGVKDVPCGKYVLSTGLSANIMPRKRTKINILGDTDTCIELQCNRESLMIIW